MISEIENTLRLKNLTFRYGKHLALKDINLNIEPGALCALIGPNGSGKTTLLKLAAGLLEYEEGSISIQNREIKTLNPADRAKMISFTPSGSDFAFDFSVFDAVSQGRSPYLDVLGNLSRKDIEIIETTISKMALDNFKDRSVNQLSQGERERVVIARHLAQDAPFMLFDESLAHLDLKHRLSLINELQQLATESKAILVAIHEIEFAARYFPIIILMRDGRIIAEGKREDVIKEETLSRAYDLDFRIINGKYPEEISIFPSMSNSDSMERLPR